MSTFTTLKSNARTNLNDAGIVSFTATDIDDSMQDAYDDLVCLSQCRIKRATFNWTAYASYIDFFTASQATGETALSLIAIFNNVNNMWLFDDMTRVQIDKLRWDWENALGTPRNWFAIDFRYVGFFPKYSTAAGTFDAIYSATAPTVVNTDTPEIPTDCQKLLVDYVTADLLEQWEEFKKAQIFWNNYVQGTEELKDRMANLSTADKIMRI